VAGTALTLQPALRAIGTRWSLDRPARHDLRRAARRARDFFATARQADQQLRVMHYPAPTVAPLPGQLRAGDIRTSHE